MKKMNEKSWKSLPREIIEKICLDIPACDLPFNEPWVCKEWTTVLLQPMFWIRKLKKLKIDISERIWSVLQEFEKKIIVTCLFHACLYEENVTLNTAISDKYSKVHYPSDEELEDWWPIADDLNEIIMATGILLFRSPLNVEINLQNKSNIALPLLLKILAVNATEVAINDDFGFWNFSPRVDILKMLKDNNDIVKNLTSFRGCLPSLEGLPSHISDLTLSLGVNDHNAAIDPGFSEMNTSLINVFHIKAGTDISELSQHPFDFSAFVVTGLNPSHIDWMVDTAKQFLQAPGLESGLIFCSYTLDKQASEQLFRNLSDAGLCFEHQIEIVCSSTTINSEAEKALSDLVYDLWETPGDYSAGGFRLFESDEELIEYLAGDRDINLKYSIFKD